MDRTIRAALLGLVSICLGTLGVASGQEPAPTGQGSFHQAHADSIARAQGWIRSGRPAEAESLLRGILPWAEESFGASSAEVGETLDHLITCQWQLGKSQDAETRDLAERAIRIKEDLYGPDHLEVAASLFNLGVITTIGGDYETADPIFTRVLRIREAHLPAGHGHIVSTINALANVKAYASDQAGALPLYRRSLAMAEEYLGPLDPQAITVRGNVAATLVQLGEYREARMLLERQIDLLESQDELSENLGYSYSLLARIHTDIGDLAESLPLRRRSLEIREALHPEGHPRIAESLLNLGTTLWELGYGAESRARIERAREMWEGRYGPEHPHLGSFLEALGRIAFAEGDLAEARRLGQRVLELREQGFGKDAPSVAEALHALSSIAREEGNLDEARTHLLRALTITRERIGPEHPWMAKYASDLAQIEFRDGRYPQAAELALQAERISRENLALTLRGLPERQALQYAQRRSGGLDLLLSMMARLPDREMTPLVWDSVIRARAVVLDEMAARIRRQTRGRDEASVNLLADLQQAGTRLANLYVRGPQDTQVGAYRQLLDEARRSLEGAERALTDASFAQQPVSGTGEIGWEEVSRALPAGSALVAYVLYRQSTGTAAPVPAYRVFVLAGQDAAPACLDLGAAAGIDALIADWKDEVALGALRIDRDGEASLAAYEAVGRRLRRAIWDPAAGLLGGATQVFVVPDGQIHLVNPATLPDDRGGYLVEVDPAFHSLSAEREIPMLRDPPEMDGGALVFGAPDFDSRGPLLAAAPLKDERETDGRDAAPAPFRGQRAECGELRALHFEPLPGCLAEARAVADLWHRRFAAEGHGSGGRGADEVHLLVGSEATEEALKRLAPGHRLLHIATHGFFLNGRCPSGLAGTRGIGLLLPESRAQTGDGVKPPARVENPLLLSGLALAGANQRDAARADADDGILTAQEIATLDLSGVHWAVLSACETGTGEVLSGEGVFGLQRAFRTAGVRTLITSLWAVRDDSTRRWMEAFYRAGVERGMQTAAAVRAASRRVLEDRRARGEAPHPFYWGAFLASGDWR